MKSEKRHELQKNELADWIGSNAGSAGDYFWPVAGGIIVAFAAAIGIAWYLSNRDSASAAAWDKYYQAFSEREREPALKDVVTNEPNSLAALWAKQSYADMTRSKGANLMFVERADGETKLKEAEEAYKEILAKARDPFLVTRAQFGMARTQESLCRPERAREYYEMVVKSEKDSSGNLTALGKAADREAKRLARKDQVELIAWFATQQPKKPAPTGGHGIPGLPPLNVPTDLPERPDFSIPGGLNLDSVAPPPATAPGGIEFPKPADAPATPKEEAKP
ncbi:hypothetical protein [Anatilimnocola floriformis]|uniref:hypothetical protein n=1 Tax=Anatilimnocola floriformis TaxID=2948575 RepID=UPI0020C375BE|nr:hypothetical protein [Anatilimnocola floriformis]